MILRLAREQLRSGRRYTAWSGLLLTMAIALASAAFVGASTQLTTNTLASHEYLPRLDHVAWVSWWTDGLPEDDPELLPYAEDPTVLAPGQAVAMVDEARAAGDDALVQQYTGLWAAPIDAGAGAQTLEVVSRYPDVRWDDVLIEGSAPRTGEIVVAADVAEGLGVGVGDELRLAAPMDRDDTIADAVTVTGLTRPSSYGPLMSPAPTGYVTWDDGLDYAHAIEGWRDVAAATGEPTQRLEATVTWTQGAAAFAGLEPVGIYDLSWTDLSLGFEGWPVTAISAAALVAVTMIGATFAMARSQAQRRIQWVATARVLGAKRSALVSASAVEALVIAVVATATGIALGYLAVSGLVAFERWRTPGVLLPPAPTLAPVGLALLIGLGLVLATITAVAPAFWATRVVPSAALKPVTPFSEAQLSRNVSGRWLIGLTTLAVVGIVVAAAFGWYTSPDVGEQLAAFSVASLVVLGIAVTVELARLGIRRAGALVARVPQPWAVAVESALTARWRSSGAAAAIVGLTAACIVSVIALGVYNAAFGAVDSPGAGVYRSLWDLAMMRAVPSWRLVAVAFGAFALAAVVAAAITSTARHATAADDAVQGALGLSPRDARRAAGIEVGMPIAVGALAGTTVGWAGGALFALTAPALASSIQAWGVGAAATLITVAATCGIATLVAAVASTLAAVTTKIGPPVRELARASR